MTHNIRLEGADADLLTGLGLGGLVEPAAVAPGVSKAEVTRVIKAAEDEVRRAADRCLAFDAGGKATLTAGGRSYAAGRFEVASLDELRARIAARPGAGGGRARLAVLHGVHPRTDIGTLQATATPGTLFQVASQFNCLEAPGARIVPVHAYPSDPTQGPRASVSAFPATLVRHYRAPSTDGTRFEQTDHQHLKLLDDAFGPQLAKVRAGYLQMHDVHRPDELARVLAENVGLIRVGVHDDVEVVFGHDWGGPVPAGSAQRIAQVFTSTLALGAYARGGDPAVALAICRPLLRAAYLGTLLAAIDLGQQRVVLTLIGGGVFGNPIAEIWHAILGAVAEIEPLLSRDLDVIVNCRSDLTDHARAAVRARGGAIVRFEPEQIVIER